MKEPSPTPLRPPNWQSEKHIRSGDRFWLLSDLECFTSSYFPWSPPQELFRVGIYDLATDCIGFGVFGRDIAFALLKAGISSPPWSSPAPFGIELRRVAHDGDERGRYVSIADPIALDSAIVALGDDARRRLAIHHAPHPISGMWRDLAERAAKEARIEATILGMVGAFSAGDVKRALTDPDVDVTRALRRLVDEGRVVATGKKRWTRYELPPRQVDLP